MGVVDLESGDQGPLLRPRHAQIQIRDCLRWFDEPAWKAAADRCLTAGCSLGDVAEDLDRGMQDRLLNSYLVFDGWFDTKGVYALGSAP